MSRFLNFIKSIPSFVGVEVDELKGPIFIVLESTIDSGPAGVDDVTGTETTFVTGEVDSTQSSVATGIFIIVCE